MTPLFVPLRRALFGLATVAFAALGACESAEGPIVPDSQNDSPTVTVNGVQLVTVVPDKRVAFRAAGAEVQKVSTEDGATLDSDDASLFVPPGSVASGTTIVMKPSSDGFVMFKFGPTGLEFDPPAELTISADKANLDGIDPTTLGIAGASDDAEDWQVVGGVYDPITNTVTVEIHHFSRYALCVR